ncbi:prolyl oligopeptidase family serine peptidase [Undibacterium cyanobacteriorum]|uniref:Prolyl oligopeptidase family serine peptidase n=1 Tax=Undibacterium cyanobacteriorum TaxID=3073561 RepID=A0ABY9RJY7_9BURK|nr:prolyl oligopeptidase family serine peptidase [Undibacterium sp. 20NA77.5]WMW81133.1 prolyl oligopeptidase family serine peptidase [Undibacterium sp. 20NA77.5]
MKMTKFTSSMSLALLAITGAGLSTLAMAQENLSYQTPPKSILDLADVVRAPSVQLDSQKENMLLSYRSTFKTLSELNQTEVRLGGLRINPLTNISSSMSYINQLKLRKVRDTKEIEIQGMPKNPLITFISWSPNEKKIAFTNTTDKGVELWMIDVASAKAKKLVDAKLNANLGSPYTWFKDSENLLVKTLPAKRPALIDASKDLPTGPITSNSSGSASQNRTFPDLLKNQGDEHNFVTLTSSELYKVDLNGKASLFKKADMYTDESFSPDGKWVMISTMHKPFSYIVPYSRFPSSTVVYDLNGKAVKTVNEVPLTETMPKGFSATRAGKRSLSWRADKPASLTYVVALDEGDPAKKVEFRDEVFQWDAPFDKTANSLVKTTQRFGGIMWGNDQVAVVSDNWYDTRSERTYFFNPSNSGAAPRLISDRNSQDIYSDPGRFETKRNQYQRRTLAIEDGKVFLIGAGHSKKGQFPFIDALSIDTLSKTRLYQSSFTDKIENLMSVEDLKKGEVLVQIQSKTEYPNYYFRNINSGQLNAITQFKNPYEGLKEVSKEVIKYQRNDGVELSGTLYLPAGYDTSKKDKLPLLIWAYPAEYKDKNSAGQSTHNPNAFTAPSYGSFIYWATRGYAVLDDAAFPIIGEGKTEPNDNFVPQLVANAEAAIDAVDKLGYIDRKKVAVGGHSYGAFMTANLLTHSKLFACGIARSGAYNRTLTPFGFQSEQRNYWETPEVYTAMSPFMHADKMKTPLLLVHGEADNNPGTFTLQTERYFQALKGLGAPARMVILPKESHGYAARENILHLLWEQDQFLEKCLKK